MTYRVQFELNLGGGQPPEGWAEPNKDEVIARLLGLLRALEFEADVTYPDGSNFGGFRPENFGRFD